MRTPVTNVQLVFETMFPKLNADRDDAGRYTNRSTRQVFRGFLVAYTGVETDMLNMKLQLNAKQGLIDKLEADIKHLKEAARNARR